MNTWLLSILVNNHFGVLTRVTGLFSRRGYNIASLSVGETHDPALSRITILTHTDGAGVRQVTKQLEKLEDVKSVQFLPSGETISRELLLIKLVVPSGRREALNESLSPFPCRLVYTDERQAVAEMTGEPSECEALLTALAPYTIVELCRTGITALSVTSVLE